MTKILTIEETENGYILSWEEEIFDDGDKPITKVVKKVIEEENDPLDETPHGRETMTRLLEAVAEYFCYTYERYGNKNLNIKWDKKGHKYS